MAKPFLLEIGSQNLVVDPDVITLKKVKELARAVTEVRTKHSLLTKYPMKEGEDMEGYEERVKNELRESNTRKQGESEAEFTSRLLSSGTDSQTFLFDQVKAIADVFGQASKVDEDAADHCRYVAAKTFVEDVLSICDLV